MEITELKNKVKRQGAQLIWESKQIETLIQQNGGKELRIKKRSPPSMHQIKNVNKINRRDKSKSSNMASATLHSNQALTQFRSCHEISVIAYGIEALQNLMATSDANNTTGMF